MEIYKDLFKRTTVLSLVLFMGLGTTLATVNASKLPKGSIILRAIESTDKLAIMALLKNDADYKLFTGQSISTKEVKEKTTRELVRMGGKAQIILNNERIIIGVIAAQTNSSLMRYGIEKSVLSALELKETKPASGTEGSEEDGEVYTGVAGLSVIISPTARKQNIASQACKKMIEILRKNKAIDVVFWDTFKTNKASIKVAEKCGLKKIAELLKGEYTVLALKL